MFSGATKGGGNCFAFPDVCKTPSPAGPVPIPYPNIASQSTLQNGTTTVKAKGQMIAVKGSQYSSSNGDEAGTAGGVKTVTVAVLLLGTWSALKGESRINAFGRSLPQGLLQKALTVAVAMMFLWFFGSVALS